VIEKKFGAPTSFNGTASPIARKSSLRSVRNIGAKLMTQVATKTKDKAGEDGTTTATLLGQALGAGKVCGNVAAGANPVGLPTRHGSGGPPRSDASAALVLEAVGR